MSYQNERDQFLARMTREGLPLDTTLSLLRSATTLQRLAEAQCNGSYPADNGERKVVQCIRCEQSWVRSSMVKDYSSGVRLKTDNFIPLICKDCRIVERLIAAMPHGWAIDTQGDPRGYVLRVIPPSYAERNQGRDQFNRDTIGVPTRNS
jgi:hypothetical protein